MGQTSSTQTPTDSTLMAYDLRGRYAQIVGDILEEIALARSKRNFPRWFMFLEDLHIEINQKLTTAERETYAKELEKCVNILNENASAYKGTSGNGEDKYKIYNAIQDLEMWIREKMEKNKMFGSKWDDEGL